MIKICKLCNKEFETENEKRVFCSVSCGAKWNRIVWNKKKIICEICGEEIAASSYKKHLNVHKGIKNKCVRPKIKCEICGEEVTKSNYIKHYNFCLKKKEEGRITLNKEWKQKNGKYKCPYCQKEYAKAGICTHIIYKHTDLNNTIYKKIKEHNISLETRNKISKKLKGRNLSKDHIQHLKETFEKKKKEGYIPAYVLYVKSKKGRKEISEKKIKLYKEHPEKHPNRKLAHNRKNMSYPEKVCYDWLKNNNIEFEHQKHIGKYWVDFFIIKQNIVIEIDGEYWHKEENSERQQFIEQYHKVKRIKAKENIEQKLKEIFA